MVISNSNLLIYTGSNKELGEQYRTIARTEDWRRIVLFDDEEERAAMLTLEWTGFKTIVMES